jgi:hypothetical protein
MSPWATLSLLAQAGALLEAVRPTKSDGWRELFERQESLPSREELETFMSRLDDGALRTAIAALAERQDQILAGRRPGDLPTSELDACLALGGLRQILEARRVRLQLAPSFADWLVDQALPAIRRAASYLPIGLPGLPGRRD